MSLITVPVINDSPNTLNVTFQTEYAVSAEASNPYMLGYPASIIGSATGTTGLYIAPGVQPGGAGVIGGPEYVNLLQRANASTVQSQGFSFEKFELAAHQGYEFYSVNNFVTGEKTVVAFKIGVPGGAVQYAKVPCGVITCATGAAAGATGVAAVYYPTPAGASGQTGLPAGSTLAWKVASGVGSITAGQGATGLTFVATAATGAFFVEAVLTLADGTSVQSSAPFATH